MSVTYIKALKRLGSHIAHPHPSPAHQAMLCLKRLQRRHGALLDETNAHGVVYKVILKFGVLRPQFGLNLVGLGRDGSQRKASVPQRLRRSSCCSHRQLLGPNPLTL